MINYYIREGFYPSFTKEIRISLKKVREIGIKYWSLSGKVLSVKENRFISFESSLERDFIYHIEFDRNVYKYCEQPIRIYYFNERKKTFYVPDFYVEYFSEQKKEIIEVKYEDDLITNKTRYKDKFKAASDFCLSNEMEFRIVTENHIRNDKLWNIKFLLNYKNSKIEIDFNYVNLIKNIVRDEEKITPKMLIKANNKLNEIQKATLLYTLWYCIANDILFVDLNNKIDMNSVITNYLV